jgi:hypothetical protein
MATRVKVRAAELYGVDPYLWALDQAAALRAGRLDELDLDHLAEEIEGLAILNRSAVRRCARVIMEHLLKLQHSPAQEPRSGWRATVREHRRRLGDDLTPALREHLNESLPRLYAMAREDAADAMRDHHEAAAAERLPADCPFDVEQVLGSWWPERSQGTT